MLLPQAATAVARPCRRRQQQPIQGLLFLLFHQHNRVRRAIETERSVWCDRRVACCDRVQMRAQGGIEGQDGGGDAGTDDFFVLLLLLLLLLGRYSKGSIVDCGLLLFGILGFGESHCQALL